MKSPALQHLRFELVCSGIAGCLAVGAAFVPLFEVLGYEFSELFCLFSTLSVGAITVKRLGDGTVRLGEQSLGHIAVSLIARGGLPLLLPLIVIGLNALRVPNCAMGTGLLLYLLLPVATVPVAVAVAMVMAALFRRTVWRALGYTAVVLVSLTATVVHLIVEPPIFAFHPMLGYFAGSIYDEAMDIPAGLLPFRLMSLAFFCAVLAGLELAVRRRQSRSVWAPLLALVGAGVVWGALYQQRFDLRVEASREDIIQTLGGRIESEHFVVYYPRSDDRIAGNIEAIVADHEYFYDRHRRFFEVEPDLPLVSFIYSNGDQKGRCMGAARTLIARPWSGEMHITYEGVGEGNLSHELAHLFTQPFGSGPLHLAGGSLLNTDMGLIEGAAEAAAWDAERLTFHGWAAALQRLELAPEVTEIVGVTGFWTQHSRTAYTLMGSFCRWLIERYSIGRFRELYASGDFEAVYRQPLAHLVEDWNEFLDDLPLPEAELELARFLYDRPSIFGKRCARALAARVQRGRRLAVHNRFAEAVECLEETVNDDPNNPRYRLELALYLRYNGALDRARQMALSVANREGVGRVLRARAVELIGDISWSAGDLARALERYRRVAGEPLPDDDARRVMVKIWAVSDGSIAPLVFDLLLASIPPEEAALTARMIEWEDRTGSPVLAYLVGLRLFRSREYDLAAHHLVRTIAWLTMEGDSLDSPARAVLRQARLRLGQCHFFAGRLDLARRHFIELSRAGGDPALDGHVVQALDWVRRCDWVASSREPGE